MKGVRLMHKGEGRVTWLWESFRLVLKRGVERWREGGDLV